MKLIVKQLTLLYFTIGFFCASYAQTPYAQAPVVHHSLFTALKVKGVTFGISGSLEGYYNFRGGIRSGGAYASTFDANMNIDLHKLTGFRGGTFYVDLEDHAGDNPTNALTGDWQVFDKHNASPFLQVSEIWYQQELFDRKLRVKVGKIDANTEFSVIDNGLEFINSSTQVTPTLFVFPTFPDPVPSINIFFTPGKLFYTSFAIDDANQQAGFLNFYRDPTSVQPTTDGALLLSESGLTWDHLPVTGKDGNLKLGFWKHSGTFSKFDGHTRHGAEGFYLIANQTLWEPESQVNRIRGLRVYLEYARTDSTVSPVYEHFGGGIEWAGPSANRPHDATGFGVHCVTLSPGLHLHKQHEVNLETFYKFLVTPWLNIKPDMQYIIHPGGKYRNVIVGTLLLNFAFNTI